MSQTAEMNSMGLFKHVFPLVYNKAHNFSVISGFLFHAIVELTVFLITFSIFKLPISINTAFQNRVKV